MDELYARNYERYEERHWWFRGRRKILRSLLQRLPWPAGADVLEIGVGPGINLVTLYPLQINLFGLEMNERSARIAAERSEARVFCGTVERFPARLEQRKFDAITLYDVLEHINDDQSALLQLTRRLKAGGCLLLTVPAYQWLWGEHDIINQHCRRYTMPQLREKLEKAGLQVTRATYFNTLLLLPAVFVRFAAGIAGGAASRKDRPLHSDFEYSSYGLNDLLGFIFSLEAFWLKRFNFPCGISIYCEAKLQDSPAGMEYASEL